MRSVATTRAPRPSGSQAVDHSGFEPVLAAFGHGGLGEATNHLDELEHYLKGLQAVGPDELGHDEALAYWLNLYNAVAVRLAMGAWLAGEDSVLVVEVAGEALSLDDVEHGKVRRFKDPRVHGALVCGALSCPTLRIAPYTGAGLDWQLADQLRSFLEAGGVVDDGEGGVILSRVFLWYGADFARPQRMPTFLPASRRRILAAVRPWLPPEVARAQSVSFQSYDWGLACSVR